MMQIYSEDHTQCYEKCAYVDSSGMADHVFRLGIAQCAGYRTVGGLLVQNCSRQAESGG